MPRSLSSPPPPLLFPHSLYRDYGAEDSKQSPRHLSPLPLPAATFRATPASHLRPDGYRPAATSIISLYLAHTADASGRAAKAAAAAAYATLRVDESASPAMTRRYAGLRFIFACLS